MGLKTWMTGVGRSLRAFTRRMADDARGNVAMLFGLSLPVLILMTVGGVDIHRASTVRVNLQDALDAAALAAARSPYTANVDIQRVGLASLKANLKAYPNITLNETATTFVLDSNDVVIANSKVDVKTLVANIFLPPYGKFMDDTLPVGAHSEVDRSSRNIEVAMVLDVTGSMAGQRLTDLKAAAKDLIDIVVQTVQTPYYSKVALIPYSMGVNLASNAASARGSVTGSTAITNATWTTGPVKTITAATKAQPVVITSSSHGFANGDVVWITGVSGMTSLNKKAFVVTNKTTNTFELYTLGGSRVDGRNYNSYSGNGSIQKCQNSNCSIVITSANHGLANNEYVHITDVNGMVQINDDTFLVGNVTTNTYTIDMQADSSLSAYTSGGKSWCAREGCTWYAFDNMYGDLTALPISTCVTERTGSAAYTDAAPSTASTRVGRNYVGGSNPCLSSTMTGLSSNKTSLKAAIDTYSAQGSTAGQIGIAWGWYQVAPNFNSVTGSGAGAYNSAQTLKAVVIMTDGEFNTPYCNGVISRDAGSGSGNNDEKIDCAATNGDPFGQGRALCAGMKAQGIVVYTVGFQTTSGGDAESLLQDCASSADGFYRAGSGAALSDAFAAIGRDIVQLRISR